MSAKHTPTLDEEWSEYWTEGEKYLRLVNLPQRPKWFTHEIIYNVAGMAIEKLAMGFLMHKQELPEGHTLLDLLTALQDFINFPPSVIEEVKYMESFQKICAFGDGYERKPPNEEEWRRMQLTTNDVAHRLEVALAA